MYKKIPFLVVVLVPLFFMPHHVLSAVPHKLLENPITILNNRAPSGKSFEFEVALTRDTDEGSYEVFFTAGDNRVGAVASVEKKRGTSSSIPSRLLFQYTMRCSRG